MLLLVDVGNSNIVFGLSDKEQIISTFRLKSFTDKTSDEYYILISTLLKGETFEEVFISSVVPIITSALIKTFKDHFNITPNVLGQGFKTGIMLKIDDPKSLGADLLCDIVGSTKYSNNALIIDMGTATKYLLIKDKTFYGAIIAPGVAVSMKSLVSSTATLPNIELVAPRKVVGLNTINCMQSGVIYGTAAQVDGLIERIKEETNNKDLEVLAVGGLSKLITPLCKNPIKVIPNLTLQGLLEIYKKNLC